MKKRNLVLVCGLILMLVFFWCPSAQASTVVFEDDFEGSMRSEWFANHPGTFQVTTEKAQNGNYSVKTDTFDNTLNYDFTSAPITDGTIEARFYDFAENIGTYPSISVDLLNQSQGKGCSVHASPYFFQENYSVRDGTSSIHDTGIARTEGWHIVQFHTSADGFKAYLDYNLVYQTGVFEINYLQFGSQFKPDETPIHPAYFDNAKIYTEGLVQPPTLEERVEQLEQRVDALEIELTATNNRVTILEQAMQSVKNTINNIMSYLNKLPNGIKKQIGL
ncbi:hypothetical protein A2V71_02605 [Candidatus Berkelbacteria bacterium RBG_13_40_8]|uniref:Uncharacterized protein n=1 Tax=Candidatus Berkelbacteria bacterium RBG_13_40_8 TaxID=1797467 RepID=A0A1F5DPL8_9BACT|nr:MAG: hypothetical protein A2V71_02605 [Candidatus Berkelbacteria bacterium RBG_13_40_8]